MDIQHYTHDQINMEEWDDHIRLCHGSMIYARSVYLDHMCEGWTALWDKESQSVMPLPLKKKWGITYAWQPPFTQQLGVFSRQTLNPEIIRTFLSRASEICRSVNLYLNYTNRTDFVKERCNYVLNLNQPFDVLHQKFRKDLIGKALDQSLIYTACEPPEMFDMYRKYILPKNKTLSAFHLNRFQKLTAHFFNAGRAIIRKVISADNQTLSIALFLKDEQRIYYMMSATTPRGRASDANAMLLYETIREFSGRPLIFDFEGSEIPGVKFFFEKFGPVNQPYFHYQRDNLNPVFRSAKRFSDLISFPK